MIISYYALMYLRIHFVVLQYIYIFFLNRISEFFKYKKKVKSQDYFW